MPTDSPDLLPLEALAGTASTSMMSSSVTVLKYMWGLVRVR